MKRCPLMRIHHTHNTSKGPCAEGIIIVSEVDETISITKWCGVGGGAPSHISFSVAGRCVPNSHEGGQPDHTQESNWQRAPTYEPLSTDLSAGSGTQALLSQTLSMGGKLSGIRAFLVSGRTRGKDGMLASGMMIGSAAAGEPAGAEPEPGDCSIRSSMPGGTGGAPVGGRRLRLRPEPLELPPCELELPSPR